jgi:trimeric autotransporter adhesin
MRKTTLLSTCIIASVFTFNQTSLNAQANVESSRLGEVFQQTILVSGPTTSPAANRLYDPWEITYGPDDSLWVTEARGYKVKKIHPGNGGQRTILNLTDAASGGTFTPSTWRRQFTAGQNPWPQGGMMGLAIHPDFNHPTTPKKYVYIAYVHSYIGLNAVNPNNGIAISGHLFMSRLVQFTYASGTLGSPVSLCDTIVGSNDHNSGRLIIKPVGGIPFLFYALGDMGAGQYTNLSRVIKAQQLNSYEGKILRFNLESDGDAGTYDRWIPNSNPFNATLGVQSAVWANGIRNNQGFAYNPDLDKFYGSSHGPFSDDELYVLEDGKNYGHPLIIGYSIDGNYNNAKAGPSGSSLPLITSESAQATTFGAAHKETMYSFYNPPAGNTSTLWSIQYIYTNQNYTGSPGPTGLAQNVNIHWKSEAVSGLDVYTKSFIPGWKNSVLLACLKGGRIIRQKTNATGDAVVAVDGGDTITHFRSVNRFRDIAISPDGKDIFVVIDSSATTSGPTTSSPMISACRGCLQKYTFLGYNDNAGASEISTAIPLAPGLNNTITNATPTNINSTNNNLWVPVTDSLGNIIAEIDANGNNLGDITAKLYINSGTVRMTGSGKSYLDRSITINVQNQPASAVNVRFYITAAELAALVAAPGSGITDINGMNIFKNNDADGSVLTATPSLINPLTRNSFAANYVIKASISSFSTFYFASGSSILPARLLTFSGLYKNNQTNLKWEAENETSTDYYIIERSTGNGIFEEIGISQVSGNTGNRAYYQFNDQNAGILSSAKIYYRLKMMNKDGSYNYSSVVAINLSNLITSLSVIPNPVKDEAVLSITSVIDQKAKWQLIDKTGRTIMSQSFGLYKGSNNININLGNIASGIYLIKISGTQINVTQKMQKM